MILCKFENIDNTWTCSVCNRKIPTSKVKKQPKANCAKWIKYKQEHMPAKRTVEEKILIIKKHCMSCEEANFDKGAGVYSVTCPLSCGCPSMKAHPTFNRLDEISYSCGLGIELDSKLKEYQKALSNL